MSFTFPIKPEANLGADAGANFREIRNQRAPTITRDQDASRSSDVDSETEWWGIPDGLRTLYHELDIKYVVAGRYYFGFWKEAVQANGEHQEKKSRNPSLQKIH